MIAPMSVASLLIVDDDANIRDALAEYLGDKGFSVRTAEGAASMDRLLAEKPADLIILDLMMPGEDGLSICRRIAPAGAPILMLSAHGAVTDRIVGLEVGAWDYLAKPFEPRELLARVRALLRRPGGRDLGQAIGVGFAGWRFDPAGRRLRDPVGRPVALSEGEHALLTAFVERPDRILSRDVLLDLVKGLDAETYDRAVDVAVSRLRRKLARHDPAPLIETIRGVGYRFIPSVER